MSKVRVKEEEPGDFKQTNIIKVALNEEDLGINNRFREAVKNYLGDFGR